MDQGSNYDALNLILIHKILIQYSWQSHPYHLPSPFSLHQQLLRESSQT